MLKHVQIPLNQGNCDASKVNTIGCCNFLPCNRMPKELFTVKSKARMVLNPERGPVYSYA